jgi:hypothetical protein
MCIKNLGIGLAIIALMFALPITSIQAQDSLLMNYQGQLLNNSGDPLTGNYDITFSLYSGPSGGTSLWSETHTNVSVVDGLLSIVLGSHSILANSLLIESNRYLGIRVDSDNELLPRTLLTSAPSAGVAGKVIGDIETSDGSMMLRTDYGDSSLVLINRGFGPQIMMFDPQPEPPGKPIVEITGDGVLGPSIVMFDPQPEPPGKAFEIIATAGSAPSMRMYDQSGQVMGVEPSPFNAGFGWVMFDPQPEPPGKMFEINTTYGTAKSLSTARSTMMRMFRDPTGGAEQEIFNLTSNNTDVKLRMGFGTEAGNNDSYIQMMADGSSSDLTLIGPSGPLAGHPILLTSDATDARLGIGTSAPSQALHVVGDICYTGSIGACSDESFKKDIEPIENSLEAIEQIDGVKYSWRTDEFPDKGFDNNRQVGLIAQQVKEVLPEAVTLQDDGYYTIDYSRLTPLLLEAIKELKQQNDLLIKRLEALEKKE